MSVAQTQVETKAFWKSKAFWAALVAAAAIAFPKYAEQLNASLDDAIALVAIVVGLYGRWTAKAPLASTSATKTSTSALALVMALAVVGVAQERQVGLHISGGTTSDNRNQGTEFGIGVDGSVPVGTKVVAVGGLNFNRFKDEPTSLTAHTVGARGEVRYYPINNGFFGLKPFVTAGLDLTRYKLQIIKQAFLSPTLGAGVNFQDKYVLQYFYAFPDVVSAAELRAHVLRGDAYIPLGKSWRGRLGIEYQRQRSIFPVGSNQFRGTIGVSKVF